MSDIKKFKVWECKIVVHEDAELPDGFDLPPRIGAVRAIESAGVKVIGCSFTKDEYIESAGVKVIGCSFTKDEYDSLIFWMDEKK